MKSFIPLTITATLTVMGFSMNSQAAPTLSKRAGIVCNERFGNAQLHVVNLHGGKGSQVGNPNDRVVQTNEGENHLTTNPDIVNVNPSTYQFDVCTTDGWNQDDALYGQLKVTGQDNTDPTCITAVYSNDGNSYSLLQQQNCESFNGGNLENQWFKASPGHDDDLGDYVELELVGNPNDNYYNDRPIAVSQNVSEGQELVFVHPLDTPVPITLALFNYEDVNN